MLENQIPTGPSQQVPCSERQFVPAVNHVNHAIPHSLRLQGSCFRGRHRILPTPAPAKESLPSLISALLFSILLLSFPCCRLVSLVSGQYCIVLVQRSQSILSTTLTPLSQVRRSPIMSDKSQQPLPFVYQFAAGAVAGVSEVCDYTSTDVLRLYMSAWSRRVASSKTSSN